ncbi:hypothetical protein [uncultured Tateyamaria sp.]|uniref:GFA family protein n=1 Tax=uncultured Tateyamaria sp. TaxID=455651 RepID=UPI00261E6B87|nr:hypothetical protein [uncultured Tateyamaria sp.]
MADCVEVSLGTKCWTGKTLRFAGGCHCGAIRVELETSRRPEDQILGACQCSFCRKHNARAFSDPSARLSITTSQYDALHLYEFGLCTSKQVICNRCGVYVAMILIDDEEVLSVLNIDALNERARFTQEARPRVYDNESKAERIQRRRQQWIPTTLVGWLN